ncbi:DUF1643 domain-containing protein [Persicitalea jodogahamensis]|uniref:DUF1643 domain-containing protein n=1 Tax=Persicitalea jodogahamensis TaxID=402147 RepID=A0A8J3D5Y1_9BACT|nr:DUF1643 domain-containing protein [Persicitalea jodogahamensis]GHB57506.1 hypothetical protein GCM10007390_08660 [Persicitalea jodogahamensis]
MEFPIGTYREIDRQTGAKFSDCRKYRYALWRIWDDAKSKVMFVGLNPSTADEYRDDATIRRVKAFARRWGYGGIYILNCFPCITTNPNELDDFGSLSENDGWLLHFAALSKEIIFAWGEFPLVRQMGRDQELSKLIPNAKVLLTNQDGSPRHPLFVPCNIVPSAWTCQ